MREMASGRPAWQGLEVHLGKEGPQIPGAAEAGRVPMAVHTVWKGSSMVENRV